MVASAATVVAVVCLIGPAVAQQNPDGRLPIGNYGNPLVFLLRDEAVLGDIQATAEQRTALASLADRLDAVIWPARNLDASKSSAAWNEATRIAKEEAPKILDVEQLRRVDQITLWVQGTGALARNDVAEKLELTSEQRKSIGELLDSTAEEILALRKRAADGEAPAPLEEKARELKLDEQKKALELMSESQREAWQRLAGKHVDAAKLGVVTFDAPRLAVGPEGWVNVKRRIGSTKGRVVVVHFFANGCINCIRNYEHYKAWDQTFRDRGLVIIGVHTPETEAEHDVERLKSKVDEAGFDFPILVDNEKKNWEAWGTTMWPSVYLVDGAGRIRYWWYGELNWQGQPGEEMMRRRIAELLAETERNVQP